MSELPRAAGDGQADSGLPALAVFLRDLGLALHQSGAAAHELEHWLQQVGRQLGVGVEAYAVLTFLALNVRDPAGGQKTEMLRLPAYDYNMARLIELQALCREIRGTADLPSYRQRLAAIVAAPPPWGGWRFAALGFLLSASLAVLLRGGLGEILCGGLIGAVFVSLHRLCGRVPRLAPAVPVLLCALAAILAQGLAHGLPLPSPLIAAVAGVALLLPGFTLTVAMSELATQNYLAGTGRLVGALILLFLMGAGLAIGSALTVALWPAAASLPVDVLPGWAIWPAVAVLGVSLLAVVQAPWSALPVSVGGCLLAWAAYSFFGAALGEVFAAFAAAFCVAAAGHVYARISGRPAVLVQIPGLITLVPGSMGFRGLHALIGHDSLAGIGLLTDMLLTGALLAVGLLLADNLLPLLGRKAEGSE